MQKIRFVGRGAPSERLKRVIKGYKNKKEENTEGLGGNLSYFKTMLVNVDKLQRVSDESKIKITYQVGELSRIVGRHTQRGGEK